jgi:hypothetical protein
MEHKHIDKTLKVASVPHQSNFHYAWKKQVQYVYIIYKARPSIKIFTLHVLEFSTYLSDISFLFNKLLEISLKGTFSVKFEIYVWPFIGGIR